MGQEGPCPSPPDGAKLWAPVGSYLNRMQFDGGLNCAEH